VKKGLLLGVKDKISGMMLARALTYHASVAGDLYGEQQVSYAYTEQGQMSRPLRTVYFQLDSFAMRTEMKSGLS
jgi:hypothetical protein